MTLGQLPTFIDRPPWFVVKIKWGKEDKENGFPILGSHWGEWQDIMKSN